MRILILAATLAFTLGSAAAAEPVCPVGKPCGAACVPRTGQCPKGVATAAAATAAPASSNAHAIASLAAASDAAARPVGPARCKLNGKPVNCGMLATAPAK